MCAMHQEMEGSYTQLLQSAKLAAIGELSAGVAHELNNPLTCILGFAEILLLQASPDSPQRQDLETIVSEAKRAREIVRNLLDFVRPTQSERHPINVNLLLQQIVDLVRYQLEKNHVVIEEDYAPNVGLVPLDEGQIKQVFLNLINNAFQAMPDGGSLHLRTARLSSEVTVSITDTGVGIHPEDQAHIFDPFFTTKPSGTGLGLSISQGIVQAHGGRIAVESQPGKGSTFTVWLPVKGAEKNKAEAQSREAGDKQWNHPRPPVHPGQPEVPAATIWRALGRFMPSAVPVD